MLQFSPPWACRLISLRRRGELTSSSEVESVLMNHGALADVAVHAVSDQLSEHDLKVSAELQANQWL
jgi:crotonobetaine/carnitine-CoA ligase